MQKFGKQIEQDIVRKIIAQHDKTGDGMLNYDEYKMIFQDSNKIDLNKQIDDKNAITEEDADKPQLFKPKQQSSTEG